MSNKVQGTELDNPTDPADRPTETLSGRQRIVIGIPTFKRPDGLRKTLQSVERLTFDGSFSVVVAENDLEGKEGDRLVRELAPAFRHPLKSVLSSERGISSARNALVEQAFNIDDADCLVMIDDDQWVEENWLSHLVSTQQKYAADVVRGRVLPDFEGAPLTPQLMHPVYWSERLENGIVSLVQSTNGVLLSRRCMKLLPAPLFDPFFSFTGGGDKDFFVRLKNAGGRFAYSAEAIAYEVYPATRRSLSWVRNRCVRIGLTDTLVETRNAVNFLDRVSIYARLVAGILKGCIQYLFFFWSSRRREMAIGTLNRARGKISALFGRRPDYYR